MSDWLLDSTEETEHLTASAALLFWALMASGPITLRRVDGWQTLDPAPAKPPIDLAA